MNDKPKRYDILVLPPQDKPVYFIVPAFSPDDPDTSKYRYEESSCPTNFFLQGVERIIVDGDTDPHGLFEFVRSTEPLEFPDQAHNPDEEWFRVVPEAFEVTTIDGDAVEVGSNPAIAEPERSC